MPTISRDLGGRTRVEAVGDGRHPVVIVDGFYREPDVVRAAALRLAYRGSGSAYPGVRAVPDWDWTPLRRVVRRCTGIVVDAADLEVSFCMLTTRGRDLAAAQRVPHVDGAMVAGVVFLNPPAQCRGGTAFYRHRATGRERLEPDESMQAVMSSALRPPRGFITDSTDDWECLALVEMRYNRLILYSGRLFHSGYVRDGDFGATPATRRLTQNMFASPGRGRARPTGFAAWLSARLDAMPPEGKGDRHVR
jgi:hypothetical protein